MPGWEQLGMQAAGQVSGAILGLALGGINDRRQLNQQRRLQELQIQGDKELTDYNAMKQLEMWKNTSYPAQMAMLKQAGLNPALIYGSSGPGGMTNLATGNVASGNAPTGGGEIQGMMGMGLMSAMQAAQIENIKANTKKTEAETEAVAPNIEKTQAETESLTQGIQNAKAQQELTEIQTSIATIDEHIKGATQNAAVARIMTELRAATVGLNMLERQNQIDAATKDTKIGLIKQELANKAIEWYKTQAEIGGITAEVMKKLNDIQMAIQANMRDWDRLSIETQQNTMHRYEQMMKDTGFPQELTNIVTSIFGGMIGSKLTTPGEKPRNPIGFKN